MNKIVEHLLQESTRLDGIRNSYELYRYLEFNQDVELESLFTKYDVGVLVVPREDYDLPVELESLLGIGNERFASVTTLASIEGGKLSLTDGNVYECDSKGSQRYTQSVSKEVLLGLVKDKRNTFKALLYKLLTGPQPYDPFDL